MTQNSIGFTERLSMDTCEYINYLCDTFGYQITLHCMEGSLSDIWHLFVKYNYHRCDLCREVKHSMEAWSHCVARQNKVRERASVSPYIGTCYAGVTECVFPLRNIRDETVGMLCVSGYVKDKQESRARARSVADTYKLSREKLDQAVDSLNENLPDFKTLSIQVTPILNAITYLSGLFLERDEQSGRMTQREALYNRIMGYINWNYKDSSLSLKAVCKMFNIGYSYASHLIAEYNDVPFAAHVCRMRIEAAKKYLEYTNEPVSFIALEVGFNDSNYFTTTFTKQAGMSPAAWRAKYKDRDGGGEGD